MTEKFETIPKIPISWGELIDKLNILEIKLARLSDQAARANVAKELELLRGRAGDAVARVPALVAKLKTLNESLWDIEDRIRDHERSQDFGPAFVALARSVYRTNDERGRVKREINLALGSGLIEEKSYRPY